MGVGAVDYEGAAGRGPLCSWVVVRKREGGDELVERKGKGREGKGREEKRRGMMNIRFATSVVSFTLAQG